MNKLTIRMINKACRKQFRDCTDGQTYDVIIREKGELDTTGAVCLFDSYCFVDDVGDAVCVWIGDIEAGTEFVSGQTIH